MCNRRWMTIVLLGAAGLVALCFAGTIGAVALWTLAPRLGPVTSAPAIAPDTAVTGDRDDTLGTDLDGHLWTLDELEGRPYVLNFWATWCGPCRKELPEMQRLAEEFESQGVVVILINDGETVDQAREYLREYGLTLPCIVDQSSRLARRYRVRALPTTVMVGADGETAARMEGYGGPEGLRRGFEFLID